MKILSSLPKCYRMKLIGKFQLLSIQLANVFIDNNEEIRKEIIYNIKRKLRRTTNNSNEPNRKRAITVLACYIHQVVRFAQNNPILNLQSKADLIKDSEALKNTLINALNGEANSVSKLNTERKGTREAENVVYNIVLLKLAYNFNENENIDYSLKHFEKRSIMKLKLIHLIIGDWMAFYHKRIPLWAIKKAKKTDLEHLMENIGNFRECELTRHEFINEIITNNNQIVNNQQSQVNNAEEANINQILRELTNVEVGGDVFQEERNACEQNIFDNQFTISREQQLQEANINEFLRDYTNEYKDYYQ